MSDILDVMGTVLEAIDPAKNTHPHAEHKLQRGQVSRTWRKRRENIIEVRDKGGMETGERETERRGREGEPREGKIQRGREGKERRV